MNIDKVMRNLFAIGVYKSQAPRESAAVGSAKETTEVAQARSGALKPDAVALSDQVKEVQKIRQMLDRTPEVREDLVQTVQPQVRSGTFRVSVEDLAKRLLNLKHD